MFEFFSRKKFSRGQTTVEFVLLLFVSLVVLLVIYSVYSEQVMTTGFNRDSHLARASVQRIVNSANTIYSSGRGSELRVELELPHTIDFENSSIDGRVVSLTLYDGREFFATADTSIVGELLPRTGKVVVYLYFDGDQINFDYDLQSSE